MREWLTEMAAIALALGILWLYLEWKARRGGDK